MFMPKRPACTGIRLQGCRGLTKTAACCSGHNRWSKIKHDKAKVDASVTRQRAALAGELSLASKEHGPDPKTNSRLATVIAAAKKVGFPKISIESAIARGQGLSPSGAALEFLTIEAMIPPSVAIIVECETDSKLRTLNDLRLIIKEAGGSVTPTQHLFDRKGKIVCENPEGVGEEEIFDRGVEAGATDVETLPDGSVIVSTESSETTSVAQILSESSALKIVSSNITWDPKEEMMVEVPNPEVLSSSLDKIHEEPSVQNIYVNAVSH